MSPQELGMSPLSAIKEPLHQVIALGDGSSGFVYSYRSSKLESEVVLKLAKEGHEEQLFVERRALTQLGELRLLSPAASSFSGRVLRSAAMRMEAIPSVWKHIPMLLNDAELPVANIQTSPVAQILWHGNIEPQHPQELMDALQWVHSRGWLHGDVSPNNLMLAPSNRRDKRSSPTCKLPVLNSVNL
jgi:serine/threonine protein kinase